MNGRQKLPKTVTKMINNIEIGDAFRYIGTTIKNRAGEQIKRRRVGNSERIYDQTKQGKEKPAHVPFT